MMQDSIIKEIGKCYTDFIDVTKDKLPKSTKCLMIYQGHEDCFDEYFWNVFICVPCKRVFLNRIFCNKTFWNRFLMGHVFWNMDYFEKKDQLIKEVTENHGLTKWFRLDGTEFGPGMRAYSFKQRRDRLKKII